MKNFKDKIITVSNLLKKIGKFPRKKKVAMCHGVFDLVHPGHLRHLSFSKQKADILIVSVTSDRFIEKGIYRPHIPEDIRALNLSYIEIVDYVIIDENKTPIENLKIIMPDFFAKGYEYSKINNSKINKKTDEESKTIRSYGGKMLFTPGDVVHSSSKILDKQVPDISLDKIKLVFDKEGISFNDLRKTLNKIKNIKVHVIGDTIVDSLSRCSMLGGQAKTPTMSIKFESKENFIGGAAIVSQHLKAAGAQVTFTTVMGDDSLMKFAKNKLELSNINLKLILDKSRPTTNKNAFTVGNYRLIKVDTLDNSPFDSDIMNKIYHEIKFNEVDLIIFSDFRHGIFNKNTIPFLTRAIPKKILLAADSQVASRWGNILDFVNFDLITPNEKEARFSLGDQDTSIRPLATELFNKSKCKLLILKLGSKGTITYRKKDWKKVDSFYSIDSLVSNLVDPVGAGDALIAYSTLSMVATKNHAISSILGSIAASIACEKEGNIPIKIREILNKIKYIEEKTI